jgi:LysR family transcriptional regulator, carnitine catabolism transcriptional activator
MRAFVVVARHGSFNRAADELSRSQPAVTLSIKQLESYVGLKLFERTTRKVTPTTAGEKFIPVAERLLREFDMAIYDVTATADCRSGHVSMSVLPSVATRILPDVISEFTEKFPDISIHVSDYNAQGVQRSVERNEVDFGIGSLWHPNSKLEFRPLMEDRFELVCHKDHPLAAGAAEGPEFSEHWTDPGPENAALYWQSQIRVHDHQHTICDAKGQCRCHCVTDARDATGR